MRKKKKIRHKARQTTSKFITVWVLWLVTAVSIFDAFAIIYLQDITPLSTLTECIFGLGATMTGFYFWKAKAENLQKFKQSEKITMDDDYSFNSDMSEDI